MVIRYSQAVVANRTVYVSGCIGTSLETGKLVPGGAIPEAEQALTHLKNILLASDSNLSHVVKTTLFITDFKEYDGINAVYKKCTSISLDLLFIDWHLLWLYFGQTGNWHLTLFGLWYRFSFYEQFSG